MSTHKKTFPVLTLLRLVAALYVVVFHVVSPPYTVPYWLSIILRNGYLGAGMFFVLSGFLLYHRYAEDLEHGVRTRKSFWTARFMGLCPVFIVGFLFAAPSYLIEVLGKGHLWGDILAKGVLSLGLIQAWIPDAVYAFVPNGWAISAIAFFYVTFPFLAGWIFRMSWRTLALFAVATWGFAIAPSVLYVVVEPDGLSQTSIWTNAPWLIVLKHNPLLRLPDFVFGMIASRCFLITSQSEKLSLGLLFAGLVLLTAIVTLGSDRIPYPIMHNGLVTPLVAAAIMGIAGSNGRIVSLFHSMPVRKFGLASYLLLVIHMPAARYVASALRAVNLYSPNSLLFFAILGFVITGVLLGSLVFLERILARYYHPQPIHSRD